ncbi:hypothetical protein DNTS_002803 [Danionella cerebrum]|uniref:Cysteine/serine-rich nuclear protein N-terminal domain-containing protein n=1 Tax=Danionella cerebrum TaxID=2873325 RepID=A0A553ML01_9TELE|nr:hypothetical protein DNTS_002803 [Danionella translucida]
MVISFTHETRTDSHWITMATPQHGGLKRKYAFSDDDNVYSSSSPSSHSEWDSEEEIPQTESVDCGRVGSLSSCCRIPTSSILKKTASLRTKGSVGFGLVTVFFFQRCQGFSGVPNHGGNTLGMLSCHAARQQFTLTEYAEERQRLRLERLRERQQEEKLEALRRKLISSGLLTVSEAASLTRGNIQDSGPSSEQLKDMDSLRPYSSRQRRALLRASGVLHIDRDEKLRLQELRRSREDCGCRCQGSCQPQTCSCRQAGISCQMDRSGFPCGCSKECCGNPAGRIEFNSSRVRSHYIQTLAKLKPEDWLLCNYRLADTEQHPAVKNRARSLPAESAPSFHLADVRQEEISCSSDASCSSPLSMDTDERPAEEVDGLEPPLILSFSDSDVDRCPFVKELDLSVGVRVTDAIAHPETSSCNPQPECLQEKVDHVSMDPFDISTILSPSPDQTIHMDLSLSADLDLLFFDTFQEYSSIQTHFKVYSQMEHFSPLQFSRCPSPALIEDPGMSLLEALVGIS